MASSLFICNWKMYFSHTQAITWLKDHKDELNDLLTSTKHQAILCPSFDALSPSLQALNEIKITIGAQDCSAYASGPYTGQVSAQSLKEVGCTYVLIGHSETRKNLNITIADTIKKTKLAFENNLIPIVCIGETKQDYDTGASFKVIEKQLKPLLEVYKEYMLTTHKNQPTEPLIPSKSDSVLYRKKSERSEQYNKSFIIAYEPIWSIGTGVVPDNHYIQKMYTYSTQLCTMIGIQRTPLMVYGGSVDETSIQQLKKVPEIQGFLIGRASTDIKKLKKIINLV